MAGNMMNEHGYVVYTRQSDSPIWEYIRSTKESEVKNLLSALPSSKDMNYYEQAGAHLIALGQQERQKEMAFLERAFGQPFSFEDINDFIKNFNSVIIGKKRYEQALEQIKLAVTEFDKTKKHSLAPVLTSLYASKLSSALGKAINSFIHKHAAEIANNDLSAWDQEYEQIIISAAQKSFIELLKGPEIKEGLQDHFGTYEDHTDLLEKYLDMLDSGQDNIFNQIILSKIGVDKIKSLIKNNLDVIKNKIRDGARMNGWTWVQKATSLNKRAGQFGGSVNEFFNQLVQSINNGYVTITDQGSQVNIGEYQKIDNTTIYSFGCEIDIEQIISNLDQELMNSTSLNESARLMSDYYNQHLKNLTDNYILFTSGKAYGQNDYSKLGFKNDSNRRIGDLSEILSQTSEQNAQEFIDVVINAMPGAVLEKSNQAIRQSLRNKIFESMAYLLFDDWVAIGTSAGDNAIHAFTINNMEIPLSVLLIGAGKAMQEACGMQNWFSISVHYPKNVKYPTVQSYSELLPEDKYNSKNYVYEAWNDQRADALNSITFTTHFLSNFYDLVFKNLDFS